jgi:hypothetical protein
MNPTTALFLLSIVASFIVPAAAISYADSGSARVLINHPNTKTFKCIDPTGKKLLCILVVTNVKPPKKTLTCKDPDNHRFKCTYIIINKKEINRVFHKIVFLYVYVTQKHKKLLFENKSMIVPIFVTKTVVKIIHEHEYSGKVKVVVIKEEGDYDVPTSVAINCFAPCYQQEYTRALIQKTIINAPVFVTNVNQITNIVNNVNTINSVSIINNNLINNAYVNNVNTDNTNIFNPPPPPAYSPTNLFSVPPDTPLYKGDAANPNATSSLIDSSPTGPTNESTQSQINQTLPNSSSNTTTTPQASFNNSNTSSQVNNTIIPPPAPSASNTTPNNTTNNGPTENNTASNSQAITPGYNQTTQQNPTTTTPSVDCNANPEDPSCPQQNINNNPNQPQEQEPQQHTQTCSDGSVIDVNATCPSTTNNNQSADNGGGNSNYNGSNSTDDSSGSSWDDHHD